MLGEESLFLSRSLVLSLFLSLCLSVSVFCLSLSLSLSLSLFLFFFLAFLVGQPADRWTDGRMDGQTLL